MVPERIKKAIDLHASEGSPCGSFVTAVLENKLMEAVNRADGECLDNLRDIVLYCYNELPSPCWGSKEEVLLWQAKGGDARAAKACAS